MFFDDLQVRHDRGRIVEENHYYAYGLKIFALSSRAFGGTPNAFQYQGDYSEFDDDLGWNDFMLRSYDPQIGRFLQWDPYDQFASGYVGMGNDPGNLVDPTGGVVGCPAVANMVGYGGAALSGASGASSGIGLLSTAAGLAGSGMRGAAAINNVSGHNNNINQSLQTGSDYNSGSNSGGVNNGGNGPEETPKDGCPDCPEGYGKDPRPGKNQKPYYLDIDDAAISWSRSWGNLSGGKNGRTVERSSLIYGITASNGTKLYQYTFAVRFEKDEVASEGSPGPGDYENHAPIPHNATQYGHIHLHWYGSTTLGQGTGSDNRTFSRGPNRDTEINAKFSQFTMYVLGSEGSLWASYSTNMPYVRTNTGGLFGDHREGKERKVQKSKDYSFYHDNTKSINLCKCYEQ